MAHFVRKQGSVKNRQSHRKADGDNKNYGWDRTWNLWNIEFYRMEMPDDKDQNKTQHSR